LRACSRRRDHVTCNVHTEAYLHYISDESGGILGMPMQQVAPYLKLLKTWGSMR
jgi:hypothetical protein